MSLLVLEGQALRLVCVVDSNLPTRLSWAGRWWNLTLSASRSGVLELPTVQVGDEGELTCRAQHPGGSLHSSLSLSVQSECPRGWGKKGGTGGNQHPLHPHSPSPLPPPPRQPPELQRGGQLCSGLHCESPKLPWDLKCPCPLPAWPVLWVGRGWEGEARGRRWVLGEGLGAWTGVSLDARSLLFGAGGGSGKRGTSLGHNV